MSNKQHDEQDILKNPANTDVVERAIKNDFPNSIRKNHGFASASEIKAKVSFAALVTKDGYKLTRSGEYLKCCCPFHKEKTPSFFIYPNDAYALCYGCGWKGDVFDYEKRKRRTDFVGAMQNLERKAGKISREVPLDLTLRPKVKEELTQEQRDIMKKAALRLASDEHLLHFVAKARAWNSETILQLAKEGSLGWYKGALAFNYDTGMKLRDWPKKNFTWEFGGNGLWRGEGIAGATHIYITEGESDCISLLDSGIESVESGCAVVCCPGASGFKNEWGELFKGKTVTLCFDNDQAGEGGSRTAGAILKEHALSVDVLDWKGGV